MHIRRSCDNAPFTRISHISQKRKPVKRVQSRAYRRIKKKIHRMIKITKRGKPRRCKKRYFKPIFVNWYKGYVFSPSSASSFQWKDVSTVGDICIHLNICQIGLRSGDILPAALPSKVVANLIWNSSESMIEIKHVREEMRIIGVTEVKFICKLCYDDGQYSRKRIWWCKCLRPHTYQTIVSYNTLINDHDKQLIRYQFETCTKLYKFKTKCVYCRGKIYTTHSVSKLQCYMCR